MGRFHESHSTVDVKRYTNVFRAVLSSTRLSSTVQHLLIPDASKWESARPLPQVLINAVLFS